MEFPIGLVGIAVLLGIAYLSSTNRRAIRWRPVWVSLLLQLAIALFALRTPWGASTLSAINGGVVAFIDASSAGIEFLFGVWPEEVMGVEGRAVRLPFVFAVQILPIVIFMSSVFSVLYYYGILQRVIDWLARGLRWAVGISGAESLATIANVFMGMTEAPLMIRPFIASLTKSELFLVMTAGLATVAGSVLVAYMNMVGEYAGHLVAASFMAAPAAVAIAKIMVPEEEVPTTLGDTAHVQTESDAVNAIEAAANGAADGMRLALNIGAMLLAFVSLIFLFNSFLGWVGPWVGVDELSFQKIVGVVLAPLAFLLGVPWEDAFQIGELLGIKTVINEFLAYSRLTEMDATLQPRSIVIASYALCGFANFGSLAILIGGLGSIAPERRHDVAHYGIRAIIAGSLATFLSGAVAGILY